MTTRLSPASAAAWERSLALPGSIALAATHAGVAGVRQEEFAEHIEDRAIDIV